MTLRLYRGAWARPEVLKSGSPRVMYTIRIATMPGWNDERRALALLKNHAELKTTLVSLTMSHDLPILEGHVHAVARRWFDLARMHYADASTVDPAANPRTVYSRAYYAVYNASKAVRYVVRGSVSLKGDDHRKVADLPDSFPEVDSWSTKLPFLYEHGLRADYENWSDTESENQLSPVECLTVAREFLAVSEQFLLSEYGLKI
jgi:hypothetical protein